MAASFDIERIVRKPTWKSLLMEAIIENKIDPWDVDIVSLTNGFLKKVRELEMSDLSLPANVILAAAILLKYKSAYLNSLFQETGDTPPPEENVLDSPEDNRGLADIPEISFASRVPPKRPITLEEFIQEVEKVMLKEREGTFNKRRVREVKIVDMNIRKVDLEEKMNELIQRISSLADETGWVLFSALTANQNTLDKVITLLSLLHLSQKKSVDLRQDKFFDEIFIRVVKN